MLDLKVHNTDEFKNVHLNSMRLIYGLNKKNVAGHAGTSSSSSSGEVVNHIRI